MKKLVAILILTAFVSYGCAANNVETKQEHQPNVRAQALSQDIFSYTIYQDKDAKSKAVEKFLITDNNPYTVFFCDGDWCKVGSTTDGKVGWVDLKAVLKAENDYKQHIIDAHKKSRAEMLAQQQKQQISQNFEEATVDKIPGGEVKTIQGEKDGVKYTIVSKEQSFTNTLKEHAYNKPVAQKCNKESGKSKCHKAQDKLCSKTCSAKKYSQANANNKEINILKHQIATMHKAIDDKQQQLQNLQR